MKHDLADPAPLALPPDATLVIGAGPAGLAVALKLADAGEPVILLESGGDSATAQSGQDTADLNAAVQTGLPLDGVQNGRTRMLGGTAALWHGQCMRMHPIDLEARAWVPHSGWPITHAELARHYPAAEQFLDVSGNGYEASRWEEHRGLPPLAWDDANLLHDFTEYTPKPHLGQVHRERLIGHAGLHLVLHATAARVLLRDGQAVGAEVLGPGGDAQTVAARRVVIAGGGIENARLLMLSDPAGVGLGHGRENTGRYYQDHPIIRTAQVFPADFRVLQDRYIALHRQGRRLFPKVRLSPDAQRREGLLDATAVFVHDHADPARDALRRLIAAARYRKRAEHPLRDAVRSMGAPWAVARDVYRRYAKGLATGAQPQAVWLQLWLEQAPDPDSRVTLDERCDRLGLRQSRLHWKCSDLELRTSRELTRRIGADLVRLGLGKAADLPPMADDAAWRAAVGDAAHPAGTTRMSAAPADGVVDANCQVHGVGQLFLAGGSVFPTCGYANPTLTLVALSLRLADRLLEARAP